MNTGPNRKAQVLELWKLITNYYKTAKPPTRINNITEEMVKRKRDKPKFRGKAAETRHLVPFGLDLAHMMVAIEDSLFNRTLVSLFQHLVTFYMTFGQTPFNQELASSSATAFCIIYQSLSERFGTDKLWVVKPKFHLMIELAEVQTLDLGDPSRFWCYQDEDFVGMVGSIAHSRGGKRLADTTPKNVITKYRSLAVQTSVGFVCEQCCILEL